MSVLGSVVGLMMVDSKSTHWQSYQNFDPNGPTTKIFRVLKNTAPDTINPVKEIPNALHLDIHGSLLLRIKQQSAVFKYI